MISEFAKDKIFWTRKMNLKLVKFIENRPNIWNPKHPKYTNIEYRDKTYAEFAANYGNEFTGKTVKDRWTNIRSTYRNYLRKVIASRAKNEETPYKVKWPLWDACSFLRKVNNKTTISHTKECSNDDIEKSEKFNDDDDTRCQNIANNILSVFRGVQNNVFNVEDGDYGSVGHTLNSTLSQLNSFDAAKLTNKIMDILLLYNEDNPYNPNNVKSE